MVKTAKEVEVSSDGEFSMGTLYELNQQAYNSVIKPMPRKEFDQNLGYIYDWVFEKKSKYIMLLCKERSDYTVINFTEPTEKKIKYGIKTELKELLNERGVILDIRYVQESDAWEIWLRKSSESFMFMLFECEDFVIEV